LEKKELSFDEKTRIFFLENDIKINPKTHKWNKEFYVDQNLEYRLGRIPPPSISINGKTVFLCRFCQSPLPQTSYKGHGKQFCNTRCQQEYFQIRKKFEKLHENNENITMILRYPKKEKPDEILSKTKPIQRHQMEILYNDLTKKPLTVKHGNLRL